VQFTGIISGIWLGFNFIVRFNSNGIGIGFTFGLIPGGRANKHVPQLLAARPLVDSFMDEVKKISEKYSEENKKRDNQKGFDQGRHCAAETL
jgi:hypothetical protein